MHWKKFVYESRFFKRLVEEKRKAGVLENEAVIKEEAYAQIQKVVYCVVVLSLFVLVYVGTYQEKEGIIHRGVMEKGAWEKEQELYFEVDNGTVVGSTQMIIPQRNYTKQEAQEMFQEITKNLEVAVLGENQSVEQVSSDLEFMDYFGEFPVEIIWSTDKEEYINSYGEVASFSVDAKGEIVTITARLCLGEYEEEYSFPVCVVLPKEKNRAWWEQAVEHKIRALIEQEEKNNWISLPDEIAGSRLHFAEKSDRRPWEYLLVIPVVSVLLFYGTLKEEEKQKVKKEEELLREYPEIVSRLSLYIQSGMTSKKAIEKIVSDYEPIRKGQAKKQIRKFGYEELRVTYYEMQSGVSEHKAYKNLGERIGLTEYKKLSSILVQQLEKGSRSFLESLQQETKEAFEKRKRNAKEAGEKAGTRLLLPMGILLVITLVMVMIPAFLSFGF